MNTAATGEVGAVEIVGFVGGQASTSLGGWRRRSPPYKYEARRTSRQKTSHHRDTEITEERTEGGGGRRGLSIVDAGDFAAVIGAASSPHRRKKRSIAERSGSRWSVFACFAPHARLRSCRGRRGTLRRIRQAHRKQAQDKLFADSSWAATVGKLKRQNCYVMTHDTL